MNTRYTKWPQVSFYFKCIKFLTIKICSASLKDRFSFDKSGSTEMRSSVKWREGVQYINLAFQTVGFLPSCKINLLSPWQCNIQVYFIFTKIMRYHWLVIKSVTIWTYTTFVYPWHCVVIGCLFVQHTCTFIFGFNGNTYWVVYMFLLSKTY